MEWEIKLYWILLWNGNANHNCTYDMGILVANDNQIFDDDIYGMRMLVANDNHIFDVENNNQ